MPVEAAVRYFTGKIRDDPQDAFSLGMRGLLRIDSNELDMAFSDFDQAIRLDRKLTFAWVGRARVWRVRRNTTRQSPTTITRSRQNSRDAETFIERGSAWLANEKYDQVIHDCNEAIQLEPQSVVARSLRGIAWSQKKEYDKVIADLGFVIRSGKNDPVVFTLRGQTWYEKNEFDKALDDFDKAIKIDPKCAVAYIHRAATWRALAQPESTIDDYTEAIRLVPDAQGIHFSRGVAFVAIGEYDKAIADFDEAIRRDPEDAEPVYRRGDAWLETSNYDKAIADFSVVIERNPKDIEALTKRGIARHLNEEYAGAPSVTSVRRYDSILAIRRCGSSVAIPGHPTESSTRRSPIMTKRFAVIPLIPCAVLVLVCWVAKGDLDRAIEDDSAAIRLDPQCARAYAETAAPPGIAKGNTTRPL